MLSVESFMSEVSPHKHKELNFNDWLLMVHVLCSTYGWDYHTLIKQPIPFVFGLLEGIKLKSEIEEKAYKKANKKR